MATSLNERSREFAQDQIKQGHVVLDQRDDWSEHQPSTEAENEFIEAHGWDEYARSPRTEVDERVNQERDVSYPDV